MARRVVTGGRISPLYATLGPRRSIALRNCDGDAERADTMIQDWKRWHGKYGLDYVNGKGVPPPPHAETLGAGYARPVD